MPFCGQDEFSKKAVGPDDERITGAGLISDWIHDIGATLVPTLPSKAMGDPDYDDRIYRILTMIGKNTGINLDIRKLVVQMQSTRASHETEGNRLTVNELLAVYRVDQTLPASQPKVIGVLDDMLTAGNHFRAMKIKLGEAFPGVSVIGFFITRRVFPQDFASLFDDLDPVGDS